MRSRQREQNLSRHGWADRTARMLPAAPIAEQAHAQFGLFQRLLALAIQTDATFVSTERGFQAQLAGFHLLHQLFQRFKRLLELGDREAFSGTSWPCGKCGRAARGVNSPAAGTPTQLCPVRLQPGLQGRR